MDHATDHHHGDQNITEQIATYHLFDALSKWGSLVVATLVLMLTLWFCLGSGFLGGLIPGLVLFGAGAVFLGRKPAEDH